MTEFFLRDFFVVSGIALLCIATTSIITYEVMGWVWNRLPELSISSRIRVLLISAPIFSIHIVNIWLYAVVYFLLENFTRIGVLTGNIKPAVVSIYSFIQRLYFSASTYASLGLGDITPAAGLQMIASAEVLNGLVTIGWTVSFTYLAMEKFWTNK